MFFKINISPSIHNLLDKKTHAQPQLAGKQCNTSVTKYHKYHDRLRKDNPSY